MPIVPCSVAACGPRSATGRGERHPGGGENDRPPRREVYGCRENFRVYNRGTRIGCSTMRSRATSMIPPDRHACRGCGRELRQSTTAGGRRARWPVWCVACRPRRQVSIAPGRHWRRTCYRCGAPFTTGYHRQRFCGETCARRGTPARLEQARAYDRARGHRRGVPA